MSNHIFAVVVSDCRTHSWHTCLRHVIEFIHWCDTLWAQLKRRVAKNLCTILTTIILKSFSFNCTSSNSIMSYSSIFLQQHTVVRNRNLLFIIGYRSYFLTDFEFYFREILSIQFLRGWSIAIFKFISQCNNT